MKVVIQNCETLLFWQTAGNWTPQIEEASVFPSGPKALQYCLANDIPKAQVLLKFPGKEDDIKLPVSKECRDHVSV